MCFHFIWVCIEEKIEHAWRKKKRLTHISSATIGIDGQFLEDPFLSESSEKSFIITIISFTRNYDLHDLLISGNDAI